MSTYLSPFTSGLAQAGSYALNQLGAGASWMASTAPGKVLTPYLQDLGEKVTAVVSDKVTYLQNSVTSEVIKPLCSLNTFEAPCKALGFAKYLPNQPTLMDQFWNAIGLGKPTPSFLEKLQTDLSNVGSGLLDYTTTRYYQYGFIFSIAATALYSKGLNKEGAKASATVALKLSIAQAAFERYGLLNSLTGLAVFSTFTNKGFFAGTKMLLKMATMRTLIGTLTAYLGAPLVSAIFIGAIALPIAFKSAQRAQDAEEGEPILIPEDFPKTSQAVLDQAQQLGQQVTPPQVPIKE